MATDRRRNLGWALLAIAAIVGAVLVTLRFRARPAGDSGAASAFVLEQNGRDLGAAELLDAARDEDFRVDLFQDEGYVRVSRAVVDLDRDGEDDERWTFHLDGRISRRVSSFDDGEYGSAEIYDEGRWRPPTDDEPEVDPSIDAVLDDVLDGLPPLPDAPNDPSDERMIEAPRGDEPVDIDALLDQMREADRAEAGN